MHLQALARGPAPFPFSVPICYLRPLRIHTFDRALGAEDEF